MMYADRMTAEDIANLSDQRPNRINVFKRASKIKTWNMFIHLVEQENITPADALTIILKHLKQSTTAWKKYKIAGDPDQVGAIWMLLEWQDKIGTRKLYQHKYLKDFCTWTGYKKKSFSRFEDDLSMFRVALGIGRKNDGTFSLKRAERELKSRMKQANKPSKHKPVNYKNYEKTLLGWRKIN